MAQGIFNTISYVTKETLTQGPITPGQNRMKAFATDGLWVGECHVTAYDDPSQWHHHANYDSVMYMLSGRIRVDWGQEGERSFEIGKGDYAFFPRGAIHRAQIIEGEDVRYVFVRLGVGETVMNVDGPGFIDPDTGKRILVSVVES
ncbi:cupin domain-containing protein [Ottowia thiooxydans]|uniref:cupin domain-containing protein n=1 Tax=Ottowia thiooxydans TaxID=219182 RepID=UPI000426F9C6|nr:cupin domain-containing protein [Ottowia thiooxydans]